jgi:pilus assembly protein CpaE
MSKTAQLPAEHDEPDSMADHGDAHGASSGEDRSNGARPIPRISIQAFCERPQTADAMQVVAEDRRFSKAHFTTHMGGINAAHAHYQESPTPNLIVLETLESRDQLINDLDRLAEVCDAGTKVVVIGHQNDVLLYREIVKRGVSEYLVAPVSPNAVMESISNLYNDPASDPVGHVISFIAAKGGSGSSTVCHNTAWALSEVLKADVVIADLDLPFGTAGLDFNQDPVQGIAEALSSPERLDEVLLDRLLTKCSQHLSLFAAPGILDRDFDISPDACEMVLDVVRQNVPYVAVDLPHTWAPWTKRVLMLSDEIVVTASPDLASLRNTKNLFDLLKAQRKNDSLPHLVLNGVGMAKRPEISVKEFADALEMQPAAVIEFDSESFGMAANNGQMIEEVSAKAKAGAQFRELALRITNRSEPKMEKPVVKSGLLPILEKLKFKR